MIQLIASIIRQRQLILTMAKREVVSQYVGSFLGFLWTFIQPAVMIAVFWFVFSVGFKAKPMNDVPFVIWLTAGMAPWFAFSAMVLASTGAIIHHAHLIKKTVFPVEILPVVKTVSNSISHGAFMLLLIILLLCNRMPLSLYYVQAVYYFFCLCILSLGCGYFIASLNVFVRDVGQITGVVIQIGFWATPIFWDIAMMPAKVQFVLKWNPVYYIVLGYRDSFIAFIPFWERPLYSLYFWCVTLMILILGVTIFKKLAPQFADVL